MRIYPGIIGATDTVIDCYLDVIQDIACHPLYQGRGQPFQPGNERQRHRSVPVHRLHQELASHLNLEPDSIQDFNETPGAARGTISSRCRPEMIEMNRTLSDSGTQQRLRNNSEDVSLV